MKVKDTTEGVEGYYRRSRRILQMKVKDTTGGERYYRRRRRILQKE